MQLQVIEHKNQRVLTTQQLADGYGADIKNIQNNFIRNMSRYEYGVHYFMLEGEEFRHFKANHQIDDNLKFAASMCLWTEKGALLHAKSLNTDKAWEVYQELVDTYFRVRELGKPQSEAEMLLKSVQLLVEQEKAVKELKQKTTVLESRIDTIDGLNIEGDDRQKLNAMIRKYALNKGIYFGAAWKEFKQNFNIAYHANLEALKNNYNSKLTMPEYLEQSGKIEDALRVADKMLN